VEVGVLMKINAKGGAGGTMGYQRGSTGRTEVNVEKKKRP